MKDEFFVGYGEEVPQSFRKQVRRFIWIVAIALPILGITFVLSQRGFSLGTYELGKLTEIQGVIHTDPIPTLQVLGEVDQNGNIPSQTILLMSFGKFGAEKDLAKIEERVKATTNKNLHEVLVTLEGTLDYRDGRTMFELTKKENSLLEIDDSIPLGELMMELSEPSSIGKVELTGEIVDSKCYFGTMKPGEGKPHRSCAIRCISGGIPPVLITKNKEGQQEMFLLRGPNGEAIGKQLLSIIAEPVSVSGQLFAYDGWYILQVDPKTGIKSLL